MRRTKAFTLIELLVVVAIIALLISILLPSLSRAREMSKRAVGAANLRGIGQAMYIYANDNYEQFPATEIDPDLAGSNASPGNYRDPNNNDPVPGNPNAVDASPRATDGTPSTTADLWLLVQGALATPKQFICPSTSKTPDDFNGKDPAVLYDFAGAGGDQGVKVSAPNLSYGYHFGHDSNVSGDYGGGVSNGTNMDPRFPVMADENPYVFGQDKQALSDDGLSNCGAGESPNGNSLNHQEDGQNILYADSHVKFEKSPMQGIEGDNIYTRGNSGEEGGDAEHCGLQGKRVVGAGRGGVKGADLFSSTDCLILP